MFLLHTNSTPLLDIVAGTISPSFYIAKCRKIQIGLYRKYICKHKGCTPGKENSFWVLSGIFATTPPFESTSKMVYWCSYQLLESDNLLRMLSWCLQQLFIILLELVWNSCKFPVTNIRPPAGVSPVLKKQLVIEDLFFVHLQSFICSKI